MADFALVVLMAVWGSTFAIVRVLVGGDAPPVSPVLLVALRMTVAAALLLVWLGARGELRRSAGLLRDGAVCALLLGGGFLLQIEGQHRTSASRSGFLTGLLVVFVPLLEYAFFRRRPSRAHLLGIALAFAGMALLSRGASAGEARLFGDVLTVGCAVVFALHIVVLGRVAPRHGVLPLLLVQLAGSAVLALAFSPLLEPPRFARTPGTLSALAFLAVFATLFAFGVQTWAQKRVSAVRFALISALEPVFAATWAALFIGERLTVAELSGGALIVAGVVVGEAGAALLARA
jgi:drug/metabolite transporter (DMT)-like permease